MFRQICNNLIPKHILQHIKSLHLVDTRLSQMLSANQHTVAALMGKVCILIYMAIIDETAFILTSYNTSVLSSYVNISFMLSVFSYINHVILCKYVIHVFLCKYFIHVFYGKYLMCTI